MTAKPERKLKPGTIVRWVGPTDAWHGGDVVHPGDLGVVREYTRDVPKGMCDVHYFAGNYGDKMWTLLHEVEPVEVDDV